MTGWSSHRERRDVSDETGQALLYAVLLILPISALAARRLPLGTTLRYALAWIAIFLIATILVASFT